MSRTHPVKHLSETGLSNDMFKITECPYSSRDKAPMQIKPFKIITQDTNVLCMGLGKAYSRRKKSYKRIIVVAKLAFKERIESRRIN